MKKVFIFFICVLFISSVQAKTYTKEEVSCDNNKFCTDLDGKPITGIINGINEVFNNYSIEYKNGKRHGVRKEYASKGEFKGMLLLTAEYKNGVPHGEAIIYRDGKNPSTKQIWKKGKPILSLNYWCDTDKVQERLDSRTNLYTVYYKSGEKQYTLDMEGNQEFFTKDGNKFAFTNKEGIFCKQKNGKYKKNNDKKTAKKMQEMIDLLSEEAGAIGGCPIEHDFTFLCK